MKFLSLFFIAASLFCFASCSQDKPVSETPTETIETATPATPAPTNAAPVTDNNMPAAAPNTTAQPQQKVAADGNVALNPAHGEPNHRCDIPVGAPLNSPPAQQPQTIKVP